MKLTYPRYAKGLVSLLLAICLNPCMHAELSEDAVDNAMKEALTEGKHLLVAFLGTGWSMSSDRMNRKIFQDPSFKDYAANELIVLLLEARRKPPLSKEETKIFHEWVTQFDIMSYPTVILLAPDGQEVFRHGYRELDANAYVELLSNVIPERDQ